MLFIGTAIFTEENTNRMVNEMWNSMTQEVRDDYTEEYFKEKVEIMKSYITGGVSPFSIKLFI